MPSIYRLRKSDNREAFDCGVGELNEYLTRYALQNDRKGIGATYVLKQNERETRIAGFYVLSSAQIRAQDLPEDVRRRLPRYPVPVIRIGKFAVDVSLQGQSFGSVLLVDALKRAEMVSGIIAVYAVEITAKSEAAKRFYTRMGFMSLLDDERHMILSIKQIKNTFDR